MPPTLPAAPPFFAIFRRGRIAAAATLSQMEKSDCHHCAWPPISQLNIFELVFIQAEIVAEFVNERQADLFADFGLVRADRFNILLIKHEVIRSRRQVKYALLGRGHAVKETQKQPPVLPRMWRWLVGRHIFHQNSNVTDATAEFLWQRVESLLDYLDEMFTLHPSPS